MKRFPISRLITILSFALFFVGGLIFFWVQTGNYFPGTTIAEERYTVSFHADDVKNLQNGSDVSVAGVVVGHVANAQSVGNGAHLSLNIGKSAAPLHQGATVQITMKSVIGTSKVNIIDGSGPPIPNGGRLPDSTVKKAVDIDEIINTLDPQTRQRLGATVRSLATATGGTQADTSRLLSGLGTLGRQGHNALEAIAAQSNDLQSLAREATTLLNALDTGQGRIADVVRDAGQLTQATAGQRHALEQTMRGMPTLLTNAQTATNKVDELSGALAPVAANLNQSAGALNQALVQLPSVSRDLRGLLPSLNGTLDGAPATLDRIPTFGSDFRSFVPNAREALRDLNPMLNYLRNYGADIGAFAANFGAAMDTPMENGVRPVRLAPVFNTNTVHGNPLQLDGAPLWWKNPYPKPGHVGKPQPFTGEYPRLEREPK